ncbi:MAG: ferredoxin [Actinomycetota bacterium]|nr:ferredoxin [Actinomycetota bacterium]
MTYVANIDQSACAAHGDCEAIAPEIFRVDDAARVIGSGPDELMLQAAQICPTVAIRISDPDSGEQIFPRRGASELRMLSGAAWGNARRVPDTSVTPSR